MLVNGEYSHTVDTDSRGLAYGDGLFETIRLHKGRPVFLERHLDRLERGCRQLELPPCRDEVEGDIHTLAAEFIHYGIVKIIVTRGSGGRGYRSDFPEEPTRILTLHSLPIYASGKPEEGIQAFVCRQALAIQPSLAGIKHLNRLEQVMASREWPPDDKIVEGIMLDTRGRVVEGTRSNLFWIKGGKFRTPDLTDCGVAGIMREVLLDSFASQVETGRWELTELLDADEAFFCNSVSGIWPLLGIQTGGRHYTFRPGSITQKVLQLFRESLTAHES